MNLREFDTIVLQLKRIQDQTNSERISDSLSLPLPLSLPPFIPSVTSSLPPSLPPSPPVLTRVVADGLRVFDLARSRPHSADQGSAGTGGRTRAERGPSDGRGQSAIPSPARTQPPHWLLLRLFICSSRLMSGGGVRGEETLFYVFSSARPPLPVEHPASRLTSASCFHPSSTYWIRPLLAGLPWKRPLPPPPSSLNSPPGFI